MNAVLVSALSFFIFSASTFAASEVSLLIHPKDRFGRTPNSEVERFRGQLKLAFGDSVKDLPAPGFQPLYTVDFVVGVSRERGNDLKKWIDDQAEWTWDDSAAVVPLRVEVNSLQMDEAFAKNILENLSQTKIETKLQALRVLGQAFRMASADEITKIS